MSEKIANILKQLGLTASNSISGFELQNHLKSIYGGDRAETIVQLMDNRADDKGGNVGGKVFYNLKNTVLEGSLFLSSFFEYDYYSNLLAIIQKNPDLIGDRVLDIGCDCGILSCAIAMLFPKSQVIGMDRCRNAISCAEELARKNKLQNVKFIKSDILTFEDEPFSTIISSKVIHELTAKSEPALPLIADLDTYERLYNTVFNPIMQKMASICMLNGTLISVERFGISPTTYGYCKSLQSNGFSIDLDRTCSISNASTIDESGTPECYPAFIAKKDDIEHGDEFAYDAYTSLCIAQGLDFSKAEYCGWEAVAIFIHRRGEFVGGYDFYCGEKKIGERTIWKHKTDATCIIFLQAIFSDVQCAFYDIAMLQELKEALNPDEVCQTYGAIARERTRAEERCYSAMQTEFTTAI